MGEMYKTMCELDKQEQTDIDEASYRKIGAYIERNILESARMIMTTEKKHDPRVQDLMGIYQDTSDDDKPLKNFLTMRSLVYLREVTIAYYMCFGKAGITSDNYRKAIDGLAGFGTIRDSKNEVKMVDIGNEFFTNMQLAINEIEKMKNSSLPKYESFFKSIIMSEVGGKKDLKKEFSHEEVIAISNKLDELKRDKGLDKIERPIDPDILSNVFEILKDTGRSVFPEKRIVNNDKISETIPVEKVASYVVNWNSIVDLIVNIESVIKESKYNYNEAINQKFATMTKSLRSIGFKLRSLRLLVVQEVGEGAESLIPDLKSIKSKE